MIRLRRKKRNPVAAFVEKVLVNVLAAVWFVRLLWRGWRLAR